MSSEDSVKHKQTILRLRWLTIIITSYTILFSRGIDSPRLLPSLLILFYLSSNVIAYFLPTSYFLKLSFFNMILLFDTFMVSLGIYMTHQFDTDFYLVFFLIILFASIARSFKLLMVNAVVVCGIYGWFLWTKGWDLNSLENGILLRIPFIFIMNMFYGFLTQSFEVRTKQIKTELKKFEEVAQRYGQIVESAHDAVAILDEKNRIKFFNKRFLQLTQYPPEEFTGLELTRIGIELTENQITKLLTQDLGQEGKPLIHETEVFRKDGEKRKVEVSAAQFFLPTGETHTIVYLKDITERKRLGESLVQSEKLRALGEMAAGVAHDLNNVLGAILGRSQLIQLGLIKRKAGPGGISDETIQKELGTIEQAAKDGAHTIKKIQEFSRPKTEESLLVRLNVNDLIESALELLKTKMKDEAEEKGTPIKLQTVKGGECWVMGNPAELKEAFSNIVLNSIDAMSQGGTITVKAGRMNGYVSIEVSDNGAGIPELDRHRIFDPFFTTKGVQRSGLGLSISYGIIHRHRGEIRVKSQQGVGTTIEIRLPMAEVGASL